MTIPLPQHNFIKARPLVALLILCALSFKSLASSPQCSRLLVAGAEQWYPFSYTLGMDVRQATGIAHDVLDLIGEDLQLPVVHIHSMPWKRIEKELGKGNLDILAGHYWSQERQDKWLLTDPVASEDVNIFTLKGHEFAFTAPIDLRPHRGVIPRGIGLGEAFEQARSELDILEVRTHEQMYEMLNLQRVDYLISPRYASIRQLARAENESVVMLPTPLNRFAIHLALSPKSPCAQHLQDINQALATRLQNGDIQQILTRYIPLALQ